MPVSRRIFTGAALAAPFAFAGRAAAQAIPTRRIIVPFPPGGAVDLIGRLIAEQLATTAGVRPIVENIGGVGAMAGMRALADAAPDGYTVGVAPVSTLITNKYLFASMPYVPERDLVALTRIATGTVLCVANANTARERGWTSLTELVRWGREHPQQQINFGSSGNGQTSHLMAGLLNSRTNANIQHVPYRGGGPAIQDLLAGHIDMMFDVIPALMPHVRSGAFKPLAVGSADRQSFLPDVPGMKEFAEINLGDVDIQTWFSIAGPSRLAPELQTTLHRAFVAAASTPDFGQRLEAQGLSVVTDPSPEALRERIAREDSVWRELVRVSGARID